MRGYVFAFLISGSVSWAPQPTLAATDASLQAAQLRTCRSQSDEAKRLTCYDSLALEACRWEGEKTDRLACYDALAETVSPLGRKRS